MRGSCLVQPKGCHASWCSCISISMQPHVCRTWPRLGPPMGGSASASYDNFNVLVLSQSTLCTLWGCMCPYTPTRWPTRNRRAPHNCDTLCLARAHLSSGTGDLPRLMQPTSIHGACWAHGHPRLASACSLRQLHGRTSSSPRSTCRAAHPGEDVGPSGRADAHQSFSRRGQQQLRQACGIAALALASQPWVVVGAANAGALAPVREVWPAMSIRMSHDAALHDSSTMQSMHVPAVLIVHAPPRACMGAA